MPRKKRRYKAHSCYHVFNRGNRKENIFFDKRDKIYFCENLYVYAKRYHIKVEAYCLMRNHFHMILRTGARPHDLSRFMQAFMTKFAMHMNKKFGKVGHVFQGRYKAKHIPTKQDLRRVRKYIQNNPIKEGWVEDPDDYRWMRV
jgi:REP element-mobilizing transposase RayT